MPAPLDPDDTLADTHRPIIVQVGHYLNGEPVWMWLCDTCEPKLTMVWPCVHVPENEDD